MRKKGNIYKFDSLSDNDVIHGISTRFFGTVEKRGRMQQKTIVKIKNKLGINRRITFANLVHGDNVAIDPKNTNFINNVDGIIVTKKNRFIAVTSADCLPLFIYDPVKKIIGVAHAGYRGLLEGIIQGMIASFKKLDSDMASLRIYFGPAIGICCYNIPVERIEQFLAIYKYENGTYREDNGNFFIDISKIAHQIAISEGVRRQNTEVANLCTKCNNDSFFSFRGDSRESFGLNACIIGMI